MDIMIFFFFVVLIPFLVIYNAPNIEKYYRSLGKDLSLHTRSIFTIVLYPVAIFHNVKDLLEAKNLIPLTYLEKWVPRDMLFRSSGVLGAIGALYRNQYDVSCTANLGLILVKRTLYRSSEAVCSNFVFPPGKNLLQTSDLFVFDSLKHELICFFLLDASDNCDDAIFLSRYTDTRIEGILARSNTKIVRVSTNSVFVEVSGNNETQLLECVFRK